MLFVLKGCTHSQSYFVVHMLSGCLSGFRRNQFDLHSGQTLHSQTIFWFILHSIHWGSVNFYYKSL